MTDLLIGLVLVIVLGAAFAYIIKEKKKGVKCVGCPFAGSCSKTNHNGSSSECSHTNLYQAYKDGNS